MAAVLEPFKALRERERAAVRELCERYGYGNVQSLAHELWVEKDPRIAHRPTTTSMAMELKRQKKQMKRLVSVTRAARKVVKWARVCNVHSAALDRLEGAVECVKLRPKSSKRGEK